MAMVKIIQEATGKKLSTFFLMQSISMAIQKGNAVSRPGLEGLFNFHVKEAEMLWHVRNFLRGRIFSRKCFTIRNP